MVYSANNHDFESNLVFSFSIVHFFFSFFFKKPNYCILLSFTFSNITLCNLKGFEYRTKYSFPVIFFLKSHI